ncbi:MAG: GrpB family protein [Candidatus Nealsonbacteria bacterium]|nr:GrpB family protein [Candidatus Nealsonbacteria bacterium]
MAELKILPYYQKFLKDFKKEKSKISKVIKNIEIHHIGSTAVPGLGGKG